MAYKNYFQEDEKKSQGNNSGVIAGNPNVSGGASGAAPATSSGFVNLDRYLNANRGETGGLANTLVGETKDSVQENTKGVQQATDTGMGNAQGYDVSNATSQYTPQQSKVHGYFGANGEELDEGTWTSNYNNMGKEEASNYWDSNQQTIKDKQASAKSNAEHTTNDWIKANSLGTSDATNSAFGNLKTSQSNIRNRADALQNDAGAQQAKFQDSFGGSNYSKGFGTLDRFLVNADQNANEAAGGTNQIKAGMSENLGKLENIDAKVKSVNAAWADTQDKRDDSFRAKASAVGNNYAANLERTKPEYAPTAAAQEADKWKGFNERMAELSAKLEKDKWKENLTGMPKEIAERIKDLDQPTLNSHAAAMAELGAKLKREGKI